MGNQSQDEVFLAAQEAVGAHRDSQGKIFIVSILILVRRWSRRSHHDFSESFSVIIGQASGCCFGGNSFFFLGPAV